MNLHKSKIDWCTHTWNPVTGCLHGCEYCYARRFIGRFAPHATERPMVDPDSGATGIIQYTPGCYVTSRAVKLADETGAYVRSTPYPKGFAPTMHMDTLSFPEKRLTPARVFVSSMGDLFGEWVPDTWIEEVFAACMKAPQHTYLFLTKNPSRYMKLAEAGKLPEEQNFWYGSTVTDPEMPFWRSKYHNTFVSIEPLLAPFERAGEVAEKKVGWVIIGAMTGPGSRLQQPKRKWVEDILADSRAAGIPVFMKENLADVWGGDLIQEYPENMVQGEPEPQPLPHCKDCQDAIKVSQGKRGISYYCAAQLAPGRAAQHIPGRYTRTSPPWCPWREEQP